MRIHNGSLENIESLEANVIHANVISDGYLHIQYGSLSNVCNIDCVYFTDGIVEISNGEIQTSTGNVVAHNGHVRASVVTDNVLRITEGNILDAQQVSATSVITDNLVSKDTISTREIACNSINTTNVIATDITSTTAVTTNVIATDISATNVVTTNVISRDISATNLITNHLTTNHLTTNYFSDGVLTISQGVLSNISGDVVVDQGNVHTNTVFSNNTFTGTLHANKIMVLENGNIENVNFLQAVNLHFTDTLTGGNIHAQQGIINNELVVNNKLTNDGLTIQEGSLNTDGNVTASLLSDGTLTIQNGNIDNVNFCKRTSLLTQRGSQYKTAT